MGVKCISEDEHSYHYIAMACKWLVNEYAQVKCVHSMMIAYI